jgi:cysteinyl-tRNA synthetase
VDGGKMSKSLGNIYTLKDLEERGYDPLAFRYFCLGAQYRAPLHFTFEALDAAQSALQKLFRLVRDLPTTFGEIPEEIERAFREAVEDDLNTPKALAVMWDMLGSSISPEQKSSALVWMDEVLGLGIKDRLGVVEDIPQEVHDLLDKREKAREDKDWKLSDALRQELLALGYEVEDTPAGQKVRKKGS